MENFELKCNLREAGTKGMARRLRMAGLIPGVCYGHATESFALELDPIEITRVLSGPLGVNAVIDLVVVDGSTEKSRRRVMVKAVQRHPVTRRMEHVDFYAVNPEKLVQVDVPIKLVGRSKGVAAGGRMRQIMRTAKVRCLPAAIPADLVYDVSALDVKQRAQVSQIEPPPGVEVVFSIDSAFAQVIAPRGAVAGSGE